MQNNTPTRDSYTIGIICALDVELDAVEAMLDTEHARIQPVPGDSNDYTFGSIGQHDVVIGCLSGGGTGTVTAATLPKDMMRSFPIRVGLMVGMAGGVWSPQKDVRLGDVIVSVGSRNMLTEAEHLTQWALQETERSEGTMGIAALGATSQMGGIYARQGDKAKAEQWYLRALDGYDKAIADHPAQLANLSSLVRLYTEKGEVAKAETMMHRFLDVVHSSEQCDPLAVTSILDTMGSSCLDAGALTLALQVFQSALGFSEETCGPDHVNTLFIVFRLGIVYAMQDNLAAAEGMMIRAMEGYERARSAEDPKTLESAHHLGKTYASQGKGMDAEKMLLRAYITQARVTETEAKFSYALRGFEKLPETPTDRLELIKKQLQMTTLFFRKEWQEQDTARIYVSLSHRTIT